MNLQRPRRAVNYWGVSLRTSSCGVLGPRPLQKKNTRQKIPKAWVASSTPELQAANAVAAGSSSKLLLWPSGESHRFPLSLVVLNCSFGSHCRCESLFRLSAHVRGWFLQGMHVHHHLCLALVLLCRTAPYDGTCRRFLTTLTKLCYNSADNAPPGARPTAALWRRRPHPGASQGLTMEHSLCAESRDGRAGLMFQEWTGLSYS